MILIAVMMLRVPFADLLDNMDVQMIDLLRLLQRGEKLAGHQKAERRMMPAHQRLKAAQRVGDRVDDGLEVDLKLIVINCLLKMKNEIDLLERLVIHKTTPTRCRHSVCLPTVLC